MEEKNRGKYEDILHCARPDFGRRAKMSRQDRAAQFSPFAALTGFEDAIRETGRLTDNRIELDEGGKQLLEEQMQAVLAVVDTQPMVEILWFAYDERKAGGAYVAASGRVKKIDTYTQKLLLTDGRAIPLGEVLSIALLP